MSELLNGKTAWEFACEWYTPDQIRYTIANRWRNTAENMKIPDDIDSQEFAQWLTQQYRLAMAKGIDIAQQDSRAETRKLAEAKRLLREACVAWPLGGAAYPDPKGELYRQAILSATWYEQAARAGGEHE